MGKWETWWFRLLKFCSAVVRRARIKDQAHNDLSKLKTEGTDKVGLHEELPVFMIDENEKQHDVETEYLDSVQPDTEETSGHVYSHNEKMQSPTLTKLMKA